MGDMIETANNPAQHSGHSAPCFAQCKTKHRYRT